MAYRFDDISAHAFQALAQALGATVFGPGTKVFGDGADGGREASFDGPQPAVKSQGAAWNGYGIVQAKCRQYPTGDAKDAAWLIGQLKADLDKFLDPARSLRKPEYYVIITNIRLSSVDGGGAPTTGSEAQKKGGKQKVDEVFQDYKSRLGLKGWLTWDAAELRTLLDANKSIRDAYRDYITSGDVFSAVLDSMDLPFLKEKLFMKLARDMRADQDIKTKEARQNTSHSILLHELFIDLPLSNNPFARSYRYLEDDILVEPDEEGYTDDYDEVEFEDEANRPKTVAQLMIAASDKLDPLTLSRLKEGSSSKILRAPFNRVIVLGGPGQGKSTLGQYIAQIARARIIKDCSRLMSPENSGIVNNILRRAEEEGIHIGGPTRYPVRIELPKYADAISKADASGKQETSLAILDYMVETMAGAAAGLKTDHLRKWLAEYPWIVILDGLDEVPASGSRKEVLDGITELWDEIHSANADALVLVTSRQQGYGFELDPLRWSHWTLASLNKAEAMSFAKRQADVSISDPDRHSAVLDKMNKAADDPATSVLMISPLQVSMLFALAEIYDDIPSDRWTLFNRHYEVLRDREAAKGGFIGDLVRRHKTIVDEIHRSAGLALHIKAELVGAADAFFSPEEFASLVAKIITSEGQTGANAESLKTNLIMIATDRLVMLNSRIGGHIAFDVRSLQEFMAAWCLMTGLESTFMERLRRIANKSHWRHVLRIAASKIFGSEPRHLRRDVIALCQSMNAYSESSANAFLKTGSSIALDLINDNIASTFEALREQLLLVAIESISLDADSVPDIARIIREWLPDQVKTALIEMIEGPDETVKTGAMRIAILTQQPDLINCLVENLPIDPEKRLQSLATSGFAGFPSALNEVAITAAEAVGFGECRSALWSIATNNDPQAESDLSVVPTLPHQDLSTKHAVIFKQATTEGFAIRYVPLPKVPLVRSARLDLQIWSPELASVLFSELPDKNGLAAALKAITGDHELKAAQLTAFYWPLDWLIQRAASINDLGEFSKRAAEGLFGDSEDWLAAEARWSASGIVEEDLLAWNKDNPLDAIAKIGCPGPYRTFFSNYHEPGSRQPDSKSRFLNMIPNLDNPDTKLLAMRALIAGYDDEFSNDDYENMLKHIISSKIFVETAPNWLTRFVEGLPDEVFFSRSCLELFNSLLLRKRFNLPPGRDNLQRAVRACCNNPDLRGLVIYVVLNFLKIKRRPASRNRPIEEELLDLTDLARPPFVLQDGDTPAVRDHIFVKDLLLLPWTEGSTQRSAAAIGNLHSSLVRVAVEALLATNAPLPEKTVLIRQLNARLVRQRRNSDAVVHAFARACDREPSTLCRKDVLEELELA